MLHMLVVEHDKRLADFVGYGLQRDGYDAGLVETGEEALSRYQSADFVLLDMGLPDLDGVTVCRRIRESCDVPIISTVDSDVELDKVLVLQAGADDCMSKPYGLRELIARIETILRRTRPAQRYRRIITHGPLHIDSNLRQLRLHGRIFPITRKEFDLLSLLALQPEHVVSRAQIMSRVWGDEWAKNSRTIDTHVSSLRNKLGANLWITSVRGMGYRLGHE